MSLASTMLAQSMSFIHELCNYITVTLAELKASGFPRKDNWYLLTKLLFRMFAIDFNKVRSVVIEGLDVDKQDNLEQESSWQRGPYGGLFKHMAR